MIHTPNPAVRQRMKCTCEHRRHDHNADTTECEWPECSCQLFRPKARQRGLIHMGWFVHAVRGYTKCKRVARYAYLTLNMEHVDCPDCLLELERSRHGKD
jgi:hypothetical protein